MTEFQLKYLTNQEPRISLDEIKSKYEYKGAVEVSNVKEIGNLVVRYYDDDQYYSVDTIRINKEGSIFDVDNSEDFLHLGYVTNASNFTKEYNNGLSYAIIDKFSELFHKVAPVLDAVYPNQYDIQYDHEIKRLCILIKFNDITIINSRDESREIKDLYAVLKFKINNQSNVVLDSFEGFRSTLSIKDYKNGYAHSHLHKRSRGSLFGTTNFCTGSTPFSIIITDLRNTFDLEKFELFLYDLDNYVRWESLEGTPYIRLSDDSNNNIRASEITNLNRNQIESSISSYLNNSSFIPKYTMSYVNNDIKIEINESIEFMKEVGMYSNVKGAINSQGKLTPIIDINMEQVIYDEKESRLNINFKTFRNEEIKYEIQREEATTTGEFPHPEIFLKLTELISQGIREEVLSKQFQVVSFPEHLKQDLVLV